MDTKTTFEGTLSTPETEMEEIGITIEQAKEFLSKRDALARLSKNQDFKTIILEGYLKEEAVRLVSISGEAPHAANTDLIMDAIKGISHFRQYCDLIFNVGDAAEQTIRECEEALEQIQADVEGSEE